MKKIDVKSVVGIVGAVMTGFVAFATAVADKQKTDKIDELIKKVDDLTK